MTWLLPGGDASDGPVERLCVRCGDGPLLAGGLAAADEAAAAVVQAWMSAAGWSLSGPVCPGCVRELSR